MNRAQKTQLSYDGIAPRYLERNRDRSILRPWMLRFVACVPQSGVVLDLGAGPCFDSSELRHLGLRVVSLDRSRRMLALSREQFPGARVQADICHLPFRVRSIAGAWASASLLHLDREELAPALAGIANVLVGSGALFLSLKHGIGERWESRQYGSEFPRWFTYWDSQDVDAALDAAGFEITESAIQAGTKDTWLIRIARLHGRTA